MKKILKYFLIVCWLLVASITFAVIWIRTPALWFITLPRSVWDFLLDFFNIVGGEGMADLEFSVALAFGFIFASVILALFIFIGRRKTSKQQ